VGGVEGVPFALVGVGHGGWLRWVYAMLRLGSGVLRRVLCGSAEVTWQ
jgi:hypothetical protein